MKKNNYVKQMALQFLFILLGIGYGYAQLGERVYIQTDKQLYISGELLWFKLYTTDTEGKLNAFSKVGYVELLNDSVPEVQVRLDIASGSANGWMELPATLPTGYYRLTAYTRFMLNEGEKVYFEKIIAVVNPYIPQDESSKVISNLQSFQTKKTENNTLLLSADQTNYALRSNGKINIQGLPSDSISLAVAICGIEPELEASPTVQEWKNHLQKQNIPQSATHILPEYEGPIYEGNLIDINTNQPSTELGIIGLLSCPGKNIQIFNGQSDKSGHIAFYTGMTHGKKEITTVAMSPPGKSYRIDIQSPFLNHKAKQLPAIYMDTTWHRYLLQRSLGVQVMQVYTGDSISQIESAKIYEFSKPYKSYTLDDYTRFPFIEEIFTEFIAAARINKKEGKRSFTVLTEQMDRYSNQTLVLFDNIPIIDQDQICNCNPLLIKKIDVYLGRYIFGGQPFDGILSFTTYKGDYQGIKLDPGTQIFDKFCTQPTRYFYAPAYNTEASIKSPLPDFRHTLLWEPNLQTNGEKELTIPFTTSDLPGEYLITVEGIGKNGATVSGTYKIKVGD